MHCNGPIASRALTNAAEYVSMSTEHQQYSTENQSDAIRRYAEVNGFRIVRSYSDAGRSGLNISGTAFLLAAVVGSAIMGERWANGNVAIALLGWGY